MGDTLIWQHEVLPGHIVVVDWGPDGNTVSCYRKDNRVTDGLLTLYLFDVAGDTIYDVSGIGDPINLVLMNPDLVTWLSGGGLRINAPTVLQSAITAAKIINQCRTSNEFTAEVWIAPAKINQLSRLLVLDNGMRSFEFSQGDNHFGAYCSASDSAAWFSTKSPDLTLGPTHVVFTRAVNGTEKIYINGQPAASRTGAGDLSTWNPSHRLRLADREGGGFPWLGAYYLAATYGRALSDAEVLQNFEASYHVEPKPPIPSTGVIEIRYTGSVKTIDDVIIK